MTQEDKELLLIDLCARLPYGTFARIKNYEKEERDVKITVHNIEYALKIGNGWWTNCKPYLRPMSSMTDEEKEEYQAFFNYDGVEYPEEYIDWLNAHHFDYRGLIEKGLAIEALEGMYD